MAVKLKAPKHMAFSTVDYNILEDLQITWSGYLTMSEVGLQERIEGSKSKGANEFMSSGTMQSLLQLAEDHVIRSKEAAARAYIDIFLYRVTAMVKENTRLLLNFEYPISPEDFSVPLAPRRQTVGGVVGYAALLVDKQYAGRYQIYRPLRVLSSDSVHLRSFTVIEAKDFSGELSRYIPQAVAEMMACAKTLKRTCLRGVLTNGQLWIFLLVTRKPDAPGGHYIGSQPVPLLFTENLNGKRSVREDSANMIAGILTSWIEHAFDEIGQDEWFTV